MENKYRDTMARSTDEQLKAITAKRTAYEAEAFIAAVEELERRGLGTPELEREKALALVEAQTQKNEALPQVGLLTLLKPSKEYFYTPIILYLNVAIWLIMVLMGVDAFEPSVEHLINWGGNLRAFTLDGQSWRLLTSVFLHGGIFHLALNMYALLSIGIILEPAFGKQRYALCYIAMGILASISSVAYNTNIVSVGASGAIFGLDGLLLALLVTKKIDIPNEARKSLLSSTVIFIGYNLVYGLAKAGIDNAAHIGGLLSGLLIGFVYSFAASQPKRSNLISISIVIVVLLSVFLAPQFISNKYGEFDRAMERFGVLEEKAMWMYGNGLPDSSEVATFQKRVQDEGVALWRENIALLNGLQDMPADLQQRIDLLKMYSELRIKSCELISIVAANNTVENSEKVDAVEEEINVVIKQLKDLN